LFGLYLMTAHIIKSINRNSHKLSPLCHLTSASVLIRHQPQQYNYSYNLWCTQQARQFEKVVYQGGSANMKGRAPTKKRSATSLYRSRFPQASGFCIYPRDNPVSFMKDSEEGCWREAAKTVVVRRWGSNSSIGLG